MTRQWQVVDESGELIDQDDASSVASDWSVMYADEEEGNSSRSHSPSMTKSRSHVSLPNSLDSPVRPDPEVHPSAVAAGFLDASSSKKLRRQHAVAAERASVIHHLNLPDPADSRQAATRWNAVTHIKGKHSRRSTLNVDTQRAKCLRRGAQKASGFQRIQVSLMPGGKLPQGRK